MSDQPWGVRILVFILPVIVLLFYATASTHFDYTPDDTYIYLQFAKNLIHGNGISFNAGDPTYGFTSPLWLFIIAFGGKLGVNLHVAAKGMDLVLASLALVPFYLLAFEILRDVALAISATVSFSVSAWMLRWAGTGMETSLAVVLVLLTILFALRNEYVVATLCAALVTLVRPEAFLLFGLIVIDMFVNSHDRGRAVRNASKLLVLYAVIVIPWIVYAYATFGTVVPNPAFAKAGLDFRLNDSASTFVDIAKTLFVSDGLAIVVLIAGGSVLLFGKRILSAEENFYLFRQSLIGIGWIVLVPILYTITGANVAPRFVLLIIPVIVIYAYLFLSKILSTTRWSQYAYVVVLGFTALVMLQNQILYRRYIKPGIDTFEQGMEFSLIPMGRWLKEQTPPATTVFAQDVGALGYYSDRRVCDAAGRVSPDLLNLVREGYSDQRMMEEGIYRSRCNADYVVFRSSVVKEWKKSPDLEPVLTRPSVGLGISEPQLNYHTMYRVHKTER